MFGAYHWIDSIASARPATAGTVMVAVLPIILGVQMLLQALTLEVQNSPGAEETRRYARLQDEAGTRIGEKGASQAEPEGDPSIAFPTPPPNLSS